MNKDHIVTLSGALGKGDCQSIINIFESLKDYHEEGKAGNKVIYESKKCTEMYFKFYGDKAIHPLPPSEMGYDVLQSMMEKGEQIKLPLYQKPEIVSAMVKGLEKYAQQYPFLDMMPATSIEDVFKIQKYNPGECYSALHCEAMGSGLSRVLAWMFYLNDVTEGGETEFPSQDKKFQPRCGDLLIWPAHFTHPHRGIASKTQVKYIITGWTSYTELQEVFVDDLKN